MIPSVWVLFFFSLAGSLWASEEGYRPGTLIVSYQTNQTGERLDRVRLWLQGENGQLQTFPKGQAFVEDPSTLSRTIVISELPPGRYTLEFVIPNRDRFFEDPMPRDLLITSGQILKINQTISSKQEAEKNLPPLQTGSLAVRYAFPDMEEVHFQLIDDKGNVRNGPSEDDFIQQCDEHNCYLLIEEVPEGKYQLIFFRDSPASPLIERPIEIKGGESLFLFVH